MSGLMRSITISPRWSVLTSRSSVFWISCSIYGKGMIMAVNDHKDEKTIRFYQITFEIPE